MLVVHLLTGQSSSEYKAGCGIVLKSKDGMPDDFSGWSSDISCPKCATRLFVTHNMTKLIDIDNPEVAKKFHFSSKPWGFRWLIDEQLVYVYEQPEAPYAMCAFAVYTFVPECLERTPTYTDAQTAAREWVIKHGDNRVHNAPKKHRAAVKKAAPPPKPRIPEGYTGALCCVCGKIDEGDFVPNPENMLEEICMTCLISKK